MMRLPLTRWTLRGDALPERLLARRPAAFSLPGAEALRAFAGLLGEAETPDDDVQQEGAPFALPGMLPPDVTGCVSLTREIDFGVLRGDRAILEFDHLMGRGDILLDGRVLARFDSANMAEAAMDIGKAADRTGTPCAPVLDLTDALHGGRKQTLSLRFEAARPAGVCGAAFLVTTAHAHLSRVTLTADPRSGTVALRARIHALRAGRYVLRARPVGPDGEALEAREKRHVLAEGETREAMIRMELAGELFEPGRAYSPPAMKVQLFLRAANARTEGMLCDEALLLCGYPAKKTCAYVLLTAKEGAGDPAALAARLAGLHIPAVCPPSALSDAAMRALCRAGVGVCMAAPADGELRAMMARYPNLRFDDAVQAQTPDAAATAWQLCSMTAFPRAVDDTMTREELLLEAAGRALDPNAQNVRDVLAWLSALAVRLRAEAARQDRFDGALCAPGALESEDVCDALRTAFAPLHLSVLPLYGAWWTGMRFSAALEAFLPPELSEEEREEIMASAVLEDEDGAVLARFEAPCGQGGVLGVLEAALPVQPCVLTLSCKLTRGEEVLDMHTLPVYVGERGPLEAAFA